MYSLSDLFGNYPKVKIMETLAENAGEDISTPYIEKVTGVAKSTVYKHIYKLQNEGIIRKTIKVGKAQYYQLNEEDDRAKLVIMLENLIGSEYLTKIIRESGEKTFFDEIRESFQFQEAIAPTLEIGRPDSII